MYGVLEEEQLFSGPMTFLIESPILPFVFLLGALILTACSTAILRIGKYRAKEMLRSSKSTLFFYRPLLKHIFRKHDWENLYFSISISKQIYMLAYATTCFFYVISIVPALHEALHNAVSIHDWPPLLAAAGAIIALSILLDYLFRLVASIWSRQVLILAAPFASIYLVLLFPIVGIMLQLARGLTTKVRLDEESSEMFTDKARLREMIQESELQKHLDPSDQKLISSFLNFKERVAKEIMVPRVNLFALDAVTTIRDASRLFASEGYSRIPIYRDTLDEIAGVVLYKDLLKTYTDPKQNLDAQLESIAKPVLYAPENKKISHLLQEFRTKKIHMAIIVDEYGGTEGIVTIEDILEELVGEIEDEYDVGANLEYYELPAGGWAVDAKMSINDIEEKLGIKIPQNPEYETIGGYVFHYAGTIPTKGWRLSHDEFDLEVLSSDDRSIKKVRLSPRNRSS